MHWLSVSIKHIWACVIDDYDNTGAAAISENIYENNKIQTTANIFIINKKINIHFSADITSFFIIKKIFLNRNIF
ncbi:hypothetical protein HZS_4592 [Henneguya salminicola]|nr:hypothetical protein HZS_4592 [Henneguya salminicola]